MMIESTYQEYISVVNYRSLLVNYVAACGTGGGTIVVTWRTALVKKWTQELNYG